MPYTDHHPPKFKCPNALHDLVEEKGKYLESHGYQFALEHLPSTREPSIAV